jgi:hypothetical protein
MLGCSGTPPVKTTSVSGKVKLDDRPLTTGQVVFLPDTSKGNKATVLCRGQIGPEGDYELTDTGRKPGDKEQGIPVGWYKVTYFPPRNAAAPRVDPKYLSGDTTTLVIEVVENPAPGHYDLRLSNN